jgi:hypothetical protein
MHTVLSPFYAALMAATYPVQVKCFESKLLTTRATSNNGNIKLFVIDSKTAESTL